MAEFSDVDFCIIQRFDIENDDIKVDLEKKHGIVQVVNNLYEDNPKAIMLIGYEVKNGEIQEGHLCVCDLINLEKAEDGEWKLNDKNS